MSTTKTTVGTDSAAGAILSPALILSPAPILPRRPSCPRRPSFLRRSSCLRRPSCPSAVPVPGAHPVPGAVAWYRSVLSSADEGDHSRFVPGYGVHSQENARGGAVSYRKSRASIFNDMSSEDLDRWMEKLHQARQDAVPYEEAFEAYIKDYTHKMSQDEAEAAEEQAFLKGLWEAQHGTGDKTNDTSEKPSKKPSRAQMMKRQKETDAELQKVAAMHNHLCAKVVALEAEIDAFREKSRIIELMWEENLKATKISVSENNDFKGDPYVKKKRSYTPAEIKHIQEIQDDQVTQDWIERLMADAAGVGGKEVESPTIDGEDWIEVSDA
ncbi:unnamed protein product [Aureobasidium pullulans]|nr:unnamed protein product [Aureobasidium pullulans]